MPRPRRRRGGAVARGRVAALSLNAAVTRRSQRAAAVAFRSRVWLPVITGGTEHAERTSGFEMALGHTSRQLILQLAWTLWTTLLLTAAQSATRTTYSAAKIALNATNVIDGWCAPNSGGYQSDVPYNLCDEQDLAGDPAAGRGGQPQTFWSPGFTSWYYPEVFAVIDLRQVYDVTQVWAWHRYGGVHMELSFAKDRLLHPEFSLEISTTKSPTVPMPTKYWEQSWAGFNVTAAARFVSIRLYSETNLYEIVM